MIPPRPSLKWDEVVEYAFLSDFDLLRDARHEIQNCTWATPAGRLAMDSYFKLLRAHEEIDRLNVEVRRVATQLRDEDHYLRTREAALQPTNPSLAHQISVHRMLRGRFKAHHEYCLKGIAKVAGFTGTITPGEGMDTGQGASVFLEASEPLPRPPLPSQGPSSPRVAEIEDERLELEAEADDEEDDEAFSRDVEDVLSVSLDGAQLQS